MATDLKALVVVLGLALVVFVLTRRIFTRFMTEQAFSFRRNLWIGLTAAGFLIPNPALYFLLAGAIVLWAGRKESNPIALYFMLFHVVPPTRFKLPTLGFDNLFPIDQYRLLALALLLPCALRLMHVQNKEQNRPLRAIDWLIIAYGTLEIAKLIPYETITSTARRLFLFLLDVWLLYYVISRALRTRERMNEALAMFCLICTIHASVAAFEAIRTWPLYAGIAANWGSGSAYVFRAEVLRALSSAGHPLALGYMIAVAFGFWMHLRNRVESRYLVLGLSAWLWMGLIAAYSRAPWIVGAITFFTYLFLGKKGMSRTLRAAFIGLLIGGAALMTPVGDKIIDNLPFVGTVDSSTVDYRAQLGEVSWRLIKLNPIFGDAFFERDMEEIRAIQGEGIVDMVNTYAAVALYHGIFGLTIFVFIYLVALGKAYFRMKSAFSNDVELSSLGACLVACMIGTFFMMATGSFATALEMVSFALVGLLAAYSSITDERLMQRPVQPMARGSPRVRASYR